MEELTVETYKQIISDLSRILEEGRRQAVIAVNETILKTYWEMGKRLAESKEQITGPESEKFFKRLAGDLKMEPSLIYRIHQFYRLWPDGIPPAETAKQISWSHFVELLSLSEKTEREFYLKEAISEGWSRDTLRRAIQKNLFQIGKPELLQGSLARPKNPLHVYKAIVERVIDGDTLIARIDLGFDVWVTQRIRFRGINTAEPAHIRAPSTKQESRAERARKFVANTLKDISFVVLKTYKTDLYGRYVVDLFYHPTLKEKEAVYEQGIFLNSRLLEEKLADASNF